MKITELKLSERKNLGDYQHRELTITTVLDDNESESDAVNSLLRKVIWYVNKPEKAKTNAHNKAIVEANQDAEAVAKAKSAIERYEAQLKEIEG
jgi:hypothetical protein